MTKHGPTIRRFKSLQVHGSPVELLAAVEGRFGLIDIDLAATAKNRVCTRFISRSENSLKQNWTKLLRGRIGYLNPPFDPMAPWADKCVEEARKGARFVMLCQASVDSNWFWKIFPHCAVYALSPRIRFCNTRGVQSRTGFPKPLILCAFNLVGSGVNEWEVGHIARWDWKNENSKREQRAG